MGNTEAREYFTRLDQNPILFVNMVLSSCSDASLEEPQNIEEGSELAVSIIKSYNWHYPNGKSIDDDMSDIILDSSMGDLSKCLLLLYLIDVEDRIIPNSLVNLNTLYLIIKETYYEFIESTPNDWNQWNQWTEASALMVIPVLKNLRKEDMPERKPIQPIKNIETYEDILNPDLSRFTEEEIQNNKGLKFIKSSNDFLKLNLDLAQKDKNKGCLLTIVFILFWTIGVVGITVIF